MPRIVENAADIPERCHIVRLAVILSIHSPHGQLDSISRLTGALWQGHCDFPQTPSPLPAITQKTCSQRTLHMYASLP